MLAQAHGYPGISPAGRSPVVLHPNASHGLAPPYDAVPARRHRAGLSDPRPWLVVSCGSVSLPGNWSSTREPTGPGADYFATRKWSGEWTFGGRSVLMSNLAADAMG
jgi:hypothetical protein